MKLGRNKPCWCGSGIKYKKCHLGRESEAPVNHWDISKKYKSAFSVKECLVPESLHVHCKDNIVKAHTIPKSGSLKKIERKGHVYAFVPSIENIRKYNGVIYPQLLGINKASTFTGFCGFHDNDIYSPLEDKKFIGSSEQIFLLAYRSVTRELYTKKASHSLSDLRKDLDKGTSVDNQVRIQNLSFLFDVGVSAGFKDSIYHKELYEKVLLSNNFEEVKYLRISIDGPPDVMASGGIFPEVDFNGKTLQDLEDISIIPQALNFSSFYGDGQGEIVFAWLQDSDDICKPFIDSLLKTKDGDLGNALIRFFFESCENIFLKPEWWEGLNDTIKLALVNRMAGSANPTMQRSSNCLKDDGLHYVDWNILSINSNL